MQSLRFVFRKTTIKLKSSLFFSVKYPVVTTFELQTILQKMRLHNITITHQCK